MFSFLLSHPAALVKTEKTKVLLIADPHIGWETELQAKGIHVPSQTPKILNKLITIMKEFKPSGVSYNLAIRLTGKFKTAFPDGLPAIASAGMPHRPRPGIGARGRG